MQRTAGINGVEGDNKTYICVEGDNAAAEDNAEGLGTRRRINATLMDDHQCCQLRRCPWRGLSEFHSVLLCGIVARGIVTDGVVACDAMTLGVMVGSVGNAVFSTRRSVGQVSLEFFTVI